MPTVNAFSQNEPNSKMKTCKKISLILLLIIIFILAIQSFWLPALLKSQIRQGVRDALIFTKPLPDNSNYKDWVSNDKSSGQNVPIWLEVRLFNITNKDDVIENGSIPQLEIVGPIVYDELQVKTNISFNENGTQVQYILWEYYRFNKERSKIKQNDTVILLSPIIGTLYFWYESNKFIEKFILEDILKNIEPEKLFLQGTVEELLFNTFDIKLNETIDINKLEHKNITLNETFQFGLITNQTTPEQAYDSTNYEIQLTGKDHDSNNGIIISWMNTSYMTCWNPAMPLQPAHDDYFGLFTIKKDEPIYAWVSELYRNIILEYNSTKDFKNIKVYEYVVQQSPQFDNQSLYPPNAQWYQYGPSGVLNLTSCSGDVPIFVSLPLFLGAPDYMDNNKKMGLRDATIYDNTWMDVEPLTGAIFRANKSLQLNFPMYNIFNDNNTLENIEPLMVPIIIMSECEALTDQQASDFHDPIHTVNIISDILYYTGIICICIVGILSYYFIYLYGKKQGKQDTPNRYQSFD